MIFSAIGVAQASYPITAVIARQYFSLGSLAWSLAGVSVVVVTRFKITITAEAESHFNLLSAREQRLLRAAIHARLVHQPMVETRALQKLRPNPFAQFELRVGDLRVLYNVEQTEVVILAIGRKVGNKLVVKDEEFHAHQDNSTQPPRGRSQGNTD